MTTEQNQQPAGREPGKMWDDELSVVLPRGSSAGCPDSWRWERRSVRSVITKPTTSYAFFFLHPKYVESSMSVQQLAG